MAVKARFATLAALFTLGLIGIHPNLAKADGLGLDPSAVHLAAALTGDEVSVSDDVRAFYRARGYSPLWTAGDVASIERIRVLHGALASAADHGLPSGRFSADRLRDLLAVADRPGARAKAEAEITRLYLSLARALSSGIVDPKSVDDAMKRTVRPRGDRELLALMSSPAPGKAIRGLAPVSAEYAALMGEKRRLERAVRQGDWGAEIRAGVLRPGDRGAEVLALRERLERMGLLDRHLAPTFDPEMAVAVSAFQERMGLDVDGIAGPDTIAALNVAAQDRLGSVIAAMERERWVGDTRGPGRVVVVNLPEFTARVFDDGREVFRTRAVVGAVEDGKPTPEFSDEMTHMVVNPSWYVPPGIIRRDYLPKLQSNPYALSEYEIRDRSGRLVNRAAGFRQYTASTFPFSIRQKPGPDNALGRVKFMFPNPWSIYLHDTPAKNLFDRDQRAYSSGCVRLADPFGFARILLAAQEADPEQTFQSALEAGNERRISLETPVPIHLIYRTAFRGPKGDVQFRPDIYGRDAKLLAALEREGVALVPLRLAGGEALAQGDDAG